MDSRTPAGHAYRYLQPQGSLKPANGGGGKGMRALWNEEGFAEALAGAKREALGAFGDEQMFLEKLIVEPRHVEFQILADAHGSIIHLGERECSIQRRHQKIVEEAPSVALSPEILSASTVQRESRVDHDARLTRWR